jgi:hypothetical protein
MKMSDVLEMARFLILVVSVALTGGLVGWQCFTWLKHGVWYPIVLGDWIGPIGPAPNEWVGLWKIIAWLVDDCPLSTVIVVAGAIAGLRWAENERRAEQAAPADRQARRIEAIKKRSP